MNCIFLNSDCKGKLNYRMPLAAIEKSAAMCEYHWTLRQHDVRVAASTGCTCWEGYERVPGTKPCAPGSCRKKSSIEKQAVGLGEAYDAVNQWAINNPAGWDAGLIGAGLLAGGKLLKTVEKKVKKLHKDHIDEHHEVVAKSSGLVGALEEVLGNTFSMYVRTHGAHWNVRGSDFAQYHELFATIYEDVYGAIDPLAENIRKLDADAPASVNQFSELDGLSDAPESNKSEKELTKDILDANRIVLESLVKAFSIADNENEQGIANFLAERIDMHQKWNWQLSSSLDKTSSKTLSFNQVVAKTMFALNYLEKVAHGLPSHLAGFFKNIREKAHDEGVHLICNFDNCDLMKNAHQKGNHRYCTSGLCDKYDKSMFKTYWQRLIGIQHEMGYHTACDAEWCAPKKESHDIGLHEHCGVDCPDAPNDVEVARDATEPFTTPTSEPAENDLTKTTKKIAFVPSIEQLDQIRTAAHDRDIHLLCDFINCEEMNRGHQVGNHNLCNPSNCTKYDRLGFSTLWLKLRALEHNMGFHHLCESAECPIRRSSHESGKHEFCGPECPSTFDLEGTQKPSQNTAHKLAVDSTHPFGFKTQEPSFSGRIDDRDGTSVPKNIFTVSEDSEEIGRPGSPQREEGFTEEVESIAGTNDDDNPPTNITDEMEADGDDDEQDVNTRDFEDEARQGRDK